MYVGLVAPTWTRGRFGFICFIGAGRFCHTPPFSGAKDFHDYDLCAPATTHLRSALLRAGKSTRKRRSRSMLNQFVAI